MKTPIQKSPLPDGFTDEICQTFEEFSIKSSQTFPKKFKERTLTNSLYEASLALIPKPDKDTTRKESRSQLFLMNLDTKIFNKILGNQI